MCQESPKHRRSNKHFSDVIVYFCKKIPSSVFRNFGTLYTSLRSSCFDLSVKIVSIIIQGISVKYPINIPETVSLLIMNNVCVVCCAYIAWDHKFIIKSQMNIHTYIHVMMQDIPPRNSEYVARVVFLFILDSFNIPISNPLTTSKGIKQCSAMEQCCF